MHRKIKADEKKSRSCELTVGGKGIAWELPLHNI
jgi:hypothetical protein